MYFHAWVNFIYLNYFVGYNVIINCRIIQIFLLADIINNFCTRPTQFNIQAQKVKKIIYEK